MDFKDLTDEQRARVRAANTPEEILALAREEGYELSEEELEAVSGGIARRPGGGGGGGWKFAAE